VESSWTERPTFAGDIVRLEPLARDHVAALAAVGLHPDLWRRQPRNIATADDMRAYVDQALQDHARGVSAPFVIVSRRSGEIVGSTRLMNIAPAHRRLEIGATWLTPSHQGTGANVESKLLLLAHVFDTLGAGKVVFKTEAENVQSRRAITALGAYEEGTFRRHLLAEDGRARDMVFFAILAEDWPEVRSRNRARLERFLP